MKDDSKSRYDQFNWWLKNNPVTASLLLIGALIIGLSTFTDSAQNLLSFVIKEQRPDINGEWTAEVQYDWTKTRYTETFEFEGEADVAFGTASFLSRDQSILEGHIIKNQIRFVTKTEEFSGSLDNVREAIHHYTGTISGDSIRFILQTEGGFSPHTPVSFTARRVSSQ
ncbi:hypothetical protein [Sunxiuqinia dokdonensis]|uniref:Lipid/polyisoprenoid-binding YceI-like domain-containing protein n=1 Tax=Sunxiuqinia dokdonensis TaxID=1409788 RepID=A0A0L8VC50_9BACT|nr:hypothetical protein [Sunxiuqinia dokdonensis]KOH46060.1 hypothetical protein NC99_11280 [Sunxiuqinia dokdonensis]